MNTDFSMRSSVKRWTNDLGYNILNILEDHFVEKLYTPNIYIVNVLSRYA